MTQRDMVRLNAHVQDLNSQKVYIVCTLYIYT